jgi:hypothetical protein
MSGISNPTKENFLRVIKQEYGIDLTLAESTEILETLVGYYDLLAKIYHRDKTKNNDNNHENKNNEN